MEIQNTNNDNKTLKAAGIGAAAGAVGGGVLNYINQKAIINHPDEFIKKHSELLNDYTKKLDASGLAKEKINELKDTLQKASKEIIERVKSGKIDYKNVAKSAVSAALVAGGIFALGSHFINKNKSKDSQ